MSFHLRSVYVCTVQVTQTGKLFFYLIAAADKFLYLYLHVNSITYQRIICIFLPLDCIHVLGIVSIGNIIYTFVLTILKCKLTCQQISCLFVFWWKFNLSLFCLLFLFTFIYYHRSDRREFHFLFILNYTVVMLLAPSELHKTQM